MLRHIAERKKLDKLDFSSSLEEKIYIIFLKEVT